MPRPPAHNRDQDAPSPSRNGAGSDEDLHSAIALLSEDAADGHGPAAALEQQPRDDGADDGGDALEDGGAAQREAGVLRPAARTVEGRVLPRRGEAAALDPGQAVC